MKPWIVFMCVCLLILSQEYYELALVFSSLLTLFALYKNKNHICGENCKCILGCLVGDVTYLKLEKDSHDYMFEIAWDHIYDLQKKIDNLESKLTKKDIEL